jgi:hypothetical protein
MSTYKFKTKHKKSKGGKGKEYRQGINGKKKYSLSSQQTWENILGLNSQKKIKISSVRLTFLKKDW